MKHLKQLIRDESGATAIEYGLIAAGIALAIIIIVGQVGQSLDGVYQRVDQGLQPTAP